MEELNTQAHLYLIAVQDDQIEKVTLQLKSILPETALIVHTAGSVGCEVLSPYFKNHGVLYPLQTFTKSKKMSYANILIGDWIHTPLCRNDKALCFFDQ
ncbi:MAG: hypothetical protein IPF93_13455 [Saprospiraceae bacterium]|nr:hypothetical protein [Saprospiraceae bacterium]